MRKKYPMRAYHYLRFSSAKQRSGDSVERQMTWANQWCEGRKITLDDTQDISDRGVSAFRGKNRTEGGLSNFLAACRQGRIKRGSYLLVESLDRLSRENLLNGLTLVKELLIDHGVTIVTNFPAQEYSQKNIDHTVFIMSAEFARAHSESLAKSERGKFSKAKRREKIREPIPATREREGDEIYNAKLPSWLKMVGHKTVNGKRVGGKMAIDHQKAAVVRRIFELSAKGFGQRVICVKLTEAGIAPIGGAKLWHDSYIQKVLTNRAVLGEYHPSVHHGSKREKDDGAPIKDYYPAVVSRELWEQSRDAMRGRKIQRGRISKRVTNLFTGLVYEAGVPCQYRGKDVGYLQSPTHTSAGVIYSHFERVVLWFVKSIQVHQGEASQYDTLKAQADRLALAVGKLKAQIDADLVGMVDMLPALDRHMKELREVQEKRDAARVPVQARHLHTVRLVEAMKKAKGEELETLRREVRQSVRTVIDRIDVTRLKGEKDAPSLPKGVYAEVRLRNGDVHFLTYVTEKGRLIGGCHIKHEKAKLKELAAPTVQYVKPFAQIDFSDGFPCDPPPPEVAERAKLKAKCQKMRDAGKSYQKIGEAVGLTRVSIARLLNGRTDRQPAGK